MAHFLRAKKSAPKATGSAIFRLAMRKLWNEHVVWTHEYVVAALAGNPDAEAAAQRLLRNQEDIGTAMAGIYGKPAGAETTRLLKEHILIAVDLLAAAKAEDSQTFARHDARWTANAHAIAAFLAKANPHLEKGALENLLGLHLKLTKEFAVARLSQDWALAVQRYDEILVEISTLADALADGIVAQFPQRF